ncbi:MAG: ABC transporter permease [Lachnospiraceae bacterium]|nr:ABC transporter permease [Lachnospiraceae bacterium]
MAEKKERKIVEVASEAAEPAKKTATAARKKVNADGKTVIEVAPAGSATGYRIGAILLWIAAITFEILAILTYFGKINITFIPTIAWLVGLIVLDLVCVIIGSLLWKKSNKIDPASKANKLKFWLWNNLGLIVCIVAFLPLILLLFTGDNKKLDKKTKTIAVIAAVVALAIGGLCSIDWNPISKEEKEAAVAAVQGEVYWTPFGKVYHTHDDCGSLNNSDTLYKGTAQDAIENGRTRICSFCAKKDSIDTSNMLTDGNEEEAKEAD